jgi:hypothetical protein
LKFTDQVSRRQQLKSDRADNCPRRKRGNQRHSPNLFGLILGITGICVQVFAVAASAYLIRLLIIDALSPKLNQVKIEDAAS